MVATRTETFSGTIPSLDRAEGPLRDQPRGTEFIVDESQVVQTTGHVANQDDYRVELEIPTGLNRVTGWKIEVFPHEDHVNGMFTRNGNGDFLLTNVKALIRQRGTQVSWSSKIFPLEQTTKPEDRKTEWDTRYSNIKETLNDDARDGWTTQGAEGVTPHVGVYRLEEPYSFASGDRFVVVLKHRSTLGDANIGRFRLSLSSELGETVDRVDGESPLQSLYSLDEEERQEIHPLKLSADYEISFFLIRRTINWSKRN